MGGTHRRGGRQSCRASSRSAASVCARALAIDQDSGGDRLSARVALHRDGQAAEARLEAGAFEDGFGAWRLTGQSAAPMPVMQPIIDYEEHAPIFGDPL